MPTLKPASSVVSPVRDDVEVTGVYVAAMVESARAVSTLFGRRITRLLAERDIVDPDPEGWYSAASFVDATVLVADEIGSTAVRQAGVEMGRRVPLLERADDPDGALSRIDDAQQRAYRGGGDRPAGGFTYADLRPTRARVAVTEAYPYPRDLAVGCLIGIVEVATAPGTEVSVTPVDPEPHGEPAKRPEQFAFLVDW